MRLLRATIATPVGPMLTLASDDALCALEFGIERRHTRLDARLARFYPDVLVEDGTNQVITAVREWLDAVPPMQGAVAAFDTRRDVPAALSGRAAKAIGKVLPELDGRVRTALRLESRVDRPPSSRLARGPVSQNSGPAPKSRRRPVPGKMP